MKRSIDEENSQNSQNAQEETAPRKLCRTSPVILSQNGNDNNLTNDNSSSSDDMSVTRSVSNLSSDSSSSSLSSQEREFLDNYIETLEKSSTFTPSEIEGEVIRNGFSTILGSNIKDYTLYTTGNEESGDDSGDDSGSDSGSDVEDDENDEQNGQQEYKACLVSTKFVNFNEMSYLCELCVCLTIGTSVHVSIQYNIPDLKRRGELCVFWMNEELGENELERYLRQRTMLVSKKINVRHWLIFSRTETLKYFEISPELSNEANTVRTHLSNMLNL